jgi:hypothetical protein
MVTVILERSEGSPAVTLYIAAYVILSVSEGSNAAMLWSKY